MCCTAHELHLHLPGACIVPLTLWLLSFSSRNVLQVDAIFKHQSQVQGSGKQDCKRAVLCCPLLCCAALG